MSATASQPRGVPGVTLPEVQPTEWKKPTPYAELKQLIVPKRTPRVNQLLVYWFAKANTKGETREDLVPHSANIVSYNERTGCCDLNVHRLGRIAKRQRVPFSDTPKRDCWTWTEQGTPAPKPDTPTAT